MKVTQLQGVNFQIDEQEDGKVVLSFIDHRQLVPGTAPVPIEIVQVPFAPEAWKAFQRHVEADGHVSPIEIARAVPKG